MWLFAYGTTLFDPKFKYIFRYFGYIKGYKRVLYRMNVDLRGSPENPGRTATIIKTDDPELRVYGVAFDLDSKIARDIIDKDQSNNGFCRTTVIFYPKTLEEFPFKSYTVYYPNTEPLYIQCTTDEIAVAITKARGRDGPNVEYLRRVVQAMKSIAPGVIDEHLFDIKNKVDKLMAQTRADSFDPDAVVYKTLKNKADTIDYMRKFFEHIKNGNIAIDVPNSSLLVMEEYFELPGNSNFYKNVPPSASAENLKVRIIKKLWIETINKYQQIKKNIERKRNNKAAANESKIASDNSSDDGNDTSMNEESIKKGREEKILESHENSSSEEIKQMLVNKISEKVTELNSTKKLKPL